MNAAVCVLADCDFNFGDGNHGSVSIGGNNRGASHVSCSSTGNLSTSSDCPIATFLKGGVSLTDVDGPCQRLCEVDNRMLWGLFGC